MKYNKNNFYQGTKSVWVETKDIPTRDSDFQSYTRGRIWFADYDESDDKYVCFTTKYYEDIGVVYLHHLRKPIVSSEYWYTDKGVYRRSDHWGAIKSCDWERCDECDVYNSDALLTLFCKWEDFEPNFSDVERDNESTYKIKYRYINEEVESINEMLVSTVDVGLAILSAILHI